MSVPPLIVLNARRAWRWQWNQLMNGLAPADPHGNYVRPESDRKSKIILDEADLSNRSPNQFPHLIVGRSCPWAHRTWLVFELNNLSTHLKLLPAQVDQKGGRWKFNPPFLKCTSLLSLYQKCGVSPTNRATVPALIDPGKGNEQKPILISNESAQIVQALNSLSFTETSINLYPEGIQKEIDNWLRMLHTNVNNGVYCCGFSRTQKAYERASNKLFDTLAKVEYQLNQEGPWLCGEQLTLADIYLFPTLIRWELIYMPLFRCSQTPLWTFPKIWEWRQQFLAIPNVSKTCDHIAWQEDYFGALFPLNPGNIIPLGPDLLKITNSTPPAML